LETFQVLQKRKLEKSEYNLPQWAF
jgi:hypothetical protein